MSQTSDNEVNVVPETFSFFGLEKPVKIQPIKVGISNHNYFVKTQYEEYVVKFLVNQTLESIENDIAIQKELLEVGVGSPEYLQDSTGAYFFRGGDMMAVVSKRIKGVIPKDINTKLANEFGQKLATFHSSVNELPHVNNKGLMNPRISGVKSEIYSQSLPKGITHGDFHLGNALVDIDGKDSIVAMLDFEEAGENLYVVDLAVTVMSICFYNENAVDLGLIKETIRGYNLIKRLSSLERKLFSEAVDYAAKTWIKWFKENGYDKYAKRHQKRLDTFVELDIKEVFDSS